MRLFPCSGVILALLVGCGGDEGSGEQAPTTAAGASAGASGAMSCGASGSTSVAGQGGATGQAGKGGGAGPPAAGGKATGGQAAAGEAGAGGEAGGGGGQTAAGGEGGAAGAGGDPWPDVVDIRIFHTSDEHGHLESETVNGEVLGGAANVRGRLDALEGFDPSLDLLLSGGDNWGGPAISDYFFGKPVIETFNLMGYAAAALGNHEFDFGREVMGQRMAEAQHPYLSANTRIAATGELAPFVKPYALFTRKGVQVGVIGVTTPDSATAANPMFVGDLEFTDVGAEIDALVPVVRAAGAEIVVVVGHVPRFEALFAASSLTQKIDLFFTGHDHGSLQGEANGVPVLGSGSQLKSYTSVKLTYDRKAHQITDKAIELVAVSHPASDPPPAPPDAAIEQLVSGYRAQLDAALSEQIGYTASGVPMGWLQRNWVTDAWLWAVPSADIALQNPGGLRQDVLPGPVTLETLHDMMPFPNRLAMVELSGQQLIDNLEAVTGACGGPCVAVSGMTFTRQAGKVTALVKGVPLEPLASYRLLINDFMSVGGGGYLFAEQGLVATDMGMSYRDPVIEYTRSLATSEQDPLEAHLDGEPRGN